MEEIGKKYLEIIKLEEKIEVLYIELNEEYKKCYKELTECLWKK